LAPLRERREDIVLLATNFLVKYRERFNKEVTFLPNSVVELLMAYEWPGNVRELENAIQRAVLLSRNGMVFPEDLGLNIKQVMNQDQAAFSLSMQHVCHRSLKDNVLSFESEVIAKAIKEYSGKIDKVCECLGLSKTTLYEKMKRYGINAKEFKGQKMA
jgi:DNA-binding NtrC family response regulator